MADPVVDAFTDVIFDEFIKIAIPPTIDYAKNQLMSFASSLNSSTDEPADSTLPSAALLGLGRCGTNVCTEVAKLLEHALAQNSQAHQPQKDSFTLKMARMLNLAKKQGHNPYLFQPVILLADLDQQSTVQQHTTSNELVVPGYQRCRLIDIRWLFKQGCGNVPQVGQYLTRLALKSPVREEDHNDRERRKDVAEPQNRKFAEWLSARAYFLDTVGLNENASRLMFFIFSTGGGTGSGMTPELGAAQRFLMYRRAMEGRNKKGDQISHQESSCSLGLGIMPTSIGEDQKEAQSINTGRLILSYLARLRRHDLLKLQRPTITELDVPPFNCLALVSNDIMSSSDNEGKTSFESAAQKANAYISQQIFNLLVAQALPTDYKKLYENAEGQASLATVMNLGGIGESEMIRLDPGDLKNSLYGASVVGYAETKEIGTQPISELVIKAVSPPTWNKATESVDGLSILPIPRDEYEAYLRRDSNIPDIELIQKLAELPLFAKAITVVTIVSIPKADLLKQATVQELRSTVVKLFPKAKIRRYAVLPESSENLTLSFFICGSGFFTEEVLDHIRRYLLNAFCLPEYVEKFEDMMDAYISGSEPISRDQIEQNFRETEDVTRILATATGSGALLDRTLELETRAHELLGPDSPAFQSVFLTRRDALDALDCMKAGWDYEGLRQPKKSSLNRSVAQGVKLALGVKAEAANR